MTSGNEHTPATRIATSRNEFGTGSLIEGNNILPEIFKNISADEFLKMLAAVFPNGQQIKNTKDVMVERGFSEYEKLVEFNLSPKSVKAVKLANRLTLKYIPGNRIISTIDKKTAEGLIMKFAESASKGVKTYLSTLNAEFNV
ncbi:MAG: hypothetical protein Q7S39_06555, partial [Ignavibacteria bacterium]|nr:hypothetical protein [Ignavibacteria bacterium]